MPLDPIAKSLFARYRGSVWLGSPERRVHVRATVKSHETYKGALQTVISRPKVLSRTPPTTKA